MSEQKSNISNYLAAAVVVALVVWLAAPSCTPFSGLEFAFPWIGKVQVRPTPAPAPITPPSTRCLIFTATWCKPCAQLKRNVAVMSRNGWRVGPANTDDIEFIDVDGPDERLTKYKHSSVPTLVIVDQSDKEIARREGVQSADALGEWIRSTRTNAAPVEILPEGVPAASAGRGSNHLPPFAAINLLSGCCDAAGAMRTIVGDSAVSPARRCTLIAESLLHTSPQRGSWF